MRLAVAGLTKSDEVIHCERGAAVFDGLAVVYVEIVEGAAMTATVAVEPEAELSNIEPVGMVVQVGLAVEAESVDAGDPVQGASVFELGVPTTRRIGERFGTVGTPRRMSDFHSVTGSRRGFGAFCRVSLVFMDGDF